MGDKGRKKDKEKEQATAGDETQTRAAEETGQSPGQEGRSSRVTAIRGRRERVCSAG
jgi:hypothetical protein